MISSSNSMSASITEGVRARTSAGAEAEAVEGRRSLALSVARGQLVFIVWAKPTCLEMVLACRQNNTSRANPTEAMSHLRFPSRRDSVCQVDNQDEPSRGTEPARVIILWSFLLAITIFLNSNPVCSIRTRLTGSMAKVPLVNWIF